MLCSLLLMPTTLVNAYYEGYTNVNYVAIETPVDDGNWTTPAEWTDTAVPTNLSDTFDWREKWIQGTNIIQHFMIEFFTDTTDDAGDYFQLCYDRTANGGTTPQTDDVRIDWVGHTASGLTIYQGNGTGWEVLGGVSWGSDIYIVDSISDSPSNSTAHWIIELWLNKDNPAFDITGSNYQPGLRIAVYDESNSAAGVQAWPPTSQDAPDDWGLEYGTTETIPEALTIGAVIVLSSVAVAVSFYCLRKRPKTEPCTSAKTGKTNHTH